MMKSRMKMYLKKHSKGQLTGFNIIVNFNYFYLIAINMQLSVQKINKRD